VFIRRDQYASNGGDEVSVHHVRMDTISPGSLCFGNVLTRPVEIRRQD
jgi:hypothetical protein